MSLHVAVIGAGPAGITAAYVLLKKGVQVDLYEAGNAVGGMAKTITLWDQLVDLGPHRFFSSDPRVNQLWLEVVEGNYSMVRRLTRIYYKRTFFDYPIKPFNAFRGLGPLETSRCVLSYARARIAPPKDTSTFEGWVTSRFGARLFGIFFRSYSEKLWGISCGELDADFAAQRIKKLSFYEAVKAAFMGNNGSRHKTLVDEFAYPALGAGQVYENMASRIRAMGGVIHLKSPVESVHAASEKHDRVAVHLQDGSIQWYDHVISSMPVTRLVEKMGAPEQVLAHSRALRFRNTILVYLLVEGESPFPDQWIYVHSSELQTGRITNFRNWVPSINMGQRNTILCLEYWCYSDDEIWQEQEDALVQRAEQEIYHTSLVAHGKVLDGRVVRVPMCYPVYQRGYKEHVRHLEHFLSAQRGVTVIGRYGSFKYNNQDHSILMGLLAAENIADGATHDLWQLNTDYEYQESSKITEVGLVNV